MVQDLGFCVSKQLPAADDYGLLLAHRNGAGKVRCSAVSGMVPSQRFQGDLKPEEGIESAASR